MHPLKLLNFIKFNVSIEISTFYRILLTEYQYLQFVNCSFNKGNPVKLVKIRLIILSKKIRPERSFIF